MDTASGLALVLTGGGARAAYQVGVLQEIANRVPDLCFPIITGVSAGAINASFLASHPGPFPAATFGLRERWARLTSDRVYGLRTTPLLRSAARWIEQLALARPDGPDKVRGLLDVRPLREFLKESMDLEGIAANIQNGRLRAVGLSAGSYSTGGTVTFVDGSPSVSVWQRAHRVAVRTRLTLDHIMASSAIPLVFPAVRLGRNFYSDGSVRQMFPLSPSIHLGARRILAIGTSAPTFHPMDPGPEGYPSAAESLGLMLDAVFMDHLDADAEVLNRLNHLVSRSPECAGESGLRRVDFMMLRPSRNLAQVALDGLGHLPRMMRILVRGVGGEDQKGSAFLSYLLFEPTYTDRLVELGREDVRSQWPKIESFLQGRDDSGL